MFRKPCAHQGKYVDNRPNKTLCGTWKDPYVHIEYKRRVYGDLESSLRYHHIVSVVAHKVRVHALDFLPQSGQ